MFIGRLRLPDLKLYPIPNTIPIPDNDKLGPAITTLYGWQWESRFADGGGEIVGIVEWIVLVGGMEKGMFLPSVSSLVGVRTASGIEFAVGPNLSLGGIAMVIGAGYNFKFGKLNLPVNIAYVPNMNKTYNHDAESAEYDHVWNEVTQYYDEILVSEATQAYSVTHPTEILAPVG
jgi:hypothetical protein